MELLHLLLLSSVSLLAGIILTLVVQYYVLLKYFNRNPAVSPPRKPHTGGCTLPETLKTKLDHNESQDNSSNSNLAISLMLQFLFHELRHSDSIKRWLYKKLSLEFEELITKTTTGKFFEAVTIRDMHLGSQFPDVRSVSVDNVKLDKSEGHVDTLNLCVQLEYDGNFLLAVDAKMKFGKTAFLSIKVKHLSGLARLQFTRLPYTHWSFSFYNEPVLELAVESHFQGRQLQSNVTNLIVNQIKKAIRRKHTLPNYKIRYKPFFAKTDPGQLENAEETGEIVPQGRLEVMCMEMSRLAVSPDVTQLYCTFAVDSTPWICVYQKQSASCVVSEVTLSKKVGIAFKQAPNGAAVTVDGTGGGGGLRHGDVVLTVEGKTIANLAQLNKLLKMLPPGNFSVRIERTAANYKFRSSANKSLCEESRSKFPAEFSPPDDAPETVNDTTERDSTVGDANACERKKSKSLERTRSSERLTPPSVPSNETAPSKFAQTIGSFSLRKRKTSTTTTTEQSAPGPSAPSTPQHSAWATETFSNGAEAAPVTNPAEIQIEIFKGQPRDSVCVVSCDDEHSFDLKDSDRYLNVNVWGTTDPSVDGKDVLLGYINVPLAQILNECGNSLLGHYIKSYSFLPPTGAQPNSSSHPLVQHSGFEHVFCYGDALLSFVWTRDEVAELKQQQRKQRAPSSSSFAATPTIAKHDFVRTQFHRTTHCDYCSKKIWLKDAVQCKNCDMCCHKKCVVKCQSHTPCLSVDKSDGGGGGDPLHPEITMTKADEDESVVVSAQYATGGLKRVNSANNLAIPGSHFHQSQTRSLPPSPQHTPRKLSLVASNPFAACPVVLDEIQRQPDDASEIISRMVEQVLQYPTDEALMDAAKETGSNMYASMNRRVKVEKINAMVGELKKALDAATVEHMSLSRQMGTVESEVEKAKLAFLIGQADAKVQALSVLMLHYCSGLQHAQEKII